MCGLQSYMHTERQPARGDGVDAGFLHLHCLYS